MAANALTARDARHFKQLYRVAIGFLAILLMVTVLPSAARAEGPNAIEYLPGCQDRVLPRNDDGSTGVILLTGPTVPNGLTNELNFFGRTFDRLWVNNNGNVTFDGPMSTYTPFPLEGNNRQLIAPFFADVDTRNGASAQVQYGFTTYGGRPAFCVLWAGVGVGYYNTRADKLNSFQLLLVDRSDVGIGDFDIIMNYDKIRWETGEASGGTNGLGGFPARVGFSNGDPNFSFELPGSAISRALLDTNLTSGLIHNSRNSLQAGRYIYPVRNGAAPTGGTIRGFVTTSGGNPVVGAAVQACLPAPPDLDPLDNVLPRPTCFATTTNLSGRYSFPGLNPGLYDLLANPPTGSSLLPASAQGINLPGLTTIDQNLVLTNPNAPPPDTSITSVGNNDGVPVVYWNTLLTLRTDGCIGGSAYYEVTQYGNAVRGGLPPVDPPGVMTETAPGHYEVGIAPLYPIHGNAQIRIQIECLIPAESEMTNFNIYIDPSGTVFDTHGNPIEGATVRLYRSDEASGPFTQVPDGSPIMSPSNRTNPDTTDTDGQFAWDVIAGYYIVRAEALDASGAPCVNPNDATQAFVETPVLPVPPPQLNLVLVLDCGEPPNQPPVLTINPTTLEGNTTGGYSGPISGVSATDPEGGAVTLTNNAPALLPLGVNTVSWQASDPDGLSASGDQAVTVQDTTAPTIDCPDDFEGTFGEDVTLGTATANDIVDPAPAIGNNAPASFGPGTTVVIWNASDASGNTALCSQTVDLNQRPELTINPVTLEGNTTGGYSGPIHGVTATDPEGGAVTLSNNAPAHLPLGTTTVTWMATDPEGASTSGDQLVTVEDTTIPEIDCPDDISGTVGQAVSLGAATASDIVDSDVAVSNEAPTSFGPGKTFVTWTATDDSGNADTCQQLVHLTYVFSDFFGPESSTETNPAVAGQTLVFKWTLSDVNGHVNDLAIVTGHHFDPDGAGADYVLTYDFDDDNYKLRVKTPQAWADTQKTFSLELDDDTVHTATYDFR